VNACLRDAELGPLAALYGTAAAVFIIIFLVVLLLPCIALGCGNEQVQPVQELFFTRGGKRFPIEYIIDTKDFDSQSVSQSDFELENF
jgi:hypothetical protein